MINNNDPCCYTYKKQRTTKKRNGLYIDYNLSDEDCQSDLYKGYRDIKDKRLQEKRRKYLIEQEQLYKENNIEFPKWAQKELEHLREIKGNNSSRYRMNNWAYWQNQNIKWRDAYKNLKQDLQDNNIENDGIERLKRYEEEIKLYQQLNDENQGAKKNNQEKQKKIVSKEEYEQYLSDKEQKAKQRFKQLAITKGVRSPTSMFHVYQTKTNEPINNSNTIDLDEDKMEQNQQINA